MTQRLRNLLSSDRDLRQLASNAKQLMAVQRLVEQALPSSLRRASHVMRLDQQTLSIAAHHSAAAAKLKQMVPALLKHLQENGYEVTLIQVLVQVLQPQPRKVATPHRIGTKGKIQLGRLADSLPESPLRQALQKLIDHSN